ncbi:hypothetical protein NSP21_24480, partial [Salmonella enterica]|nr:hypothetical protein [Salmonella enterica]
LSKVSDQKMSGNVCENEHHIQNSNIESFDKKQVQKRENNKPEPISKNLRQNPDLHTSTLTPDLQEILQHCPQISHYAQHGIHQ